ncbi:hypothetical protein ACFC1R_35585 [Kitasatospora sp. NPDC056138]|uniref:hypothetical protein n=1 Tax=Kitasatospora sp. NPDC056138 TaxID=3345724 RepID=UPI0035D5A090
MTYIFLLTGVLEIGRISAALAGCFGLPPGEVDIAVSGEADRNWDAAVLCTYEQLGGDVTWSLDVYVPKAHTSNSTEGQTAAALAEHLGQAVLYPAESYPPSAYWLAAPHGLTTRARLYVEDLEDGDCEYAIDAVGHFVPELPLLRVERQPDLIRFHRVATPVSDDFLG